MVLGSLFELLVAFTLVVAAVYAGTLRALEVYFDPRHDSIFLSDDHVPPGER